MRKCETDFAFLSGYVIVKCMEPRIIPRKEHRISRKQVSQNAIRTLYRLNSRNFIAYLVGGCVRDLLLARTPKDFDIGTNATPGQIKRLFRNCRLIGRRFRLAHLHFQDEIVEVSTFRRAAVPSDTEDTEEAGQSKRPARHVKDEKGMVLVDNVFGTPEEDALRRDFTINALSYNIADYSVIDYSTGLSDLRQRLIRPIGDPRVRFTEDPVRMLRAVRFAASHGFTIEPDAWECICELCHTISRVSPARLYEEIQKLFLLGSAWPAFALMEKSGLLSALFPGLDRWSDGSSRRTALPEVNLKCLDQLYLSGTPVSPALLLAALFGPGLEKAALIRHRDGMPRQQALNEACKVFMEDVPVTSCIPGRVGSRLCAIIVLQHSLRRMPPRQPASVAGRPEFKDALAYLRLSAQTKGEYRTPLEWWEAFLLEIPSATLSEQPEEKPPARKKRRRRRRKPHRARQSDVSSPLELPENV